MKRVKRRGVAKAFIVNSEMAHVFWLLKETFEKGALSTVFGGEILQEVQVLTNIIIGL